MRTFTHLLPMIGLIWLVLAQLIWSSTHPRLLVRPSELPSMQLKVREQEWARRAYRKLTEKINPIAQKVSEDPDWLRSRLMMNWETRYTLPVTAKSRWIRGEGRAPVPTPRFAGARDWNTNYRSPSNLDDWKPYNSWGDKIWLSNKETGEMEWVHPSETGQTLTSANVRILKIASEAAFLFWMTGEERYAKVAVPILWTYMEGFSHVLPPLVEDDDQNSVAIIGMTSFEVIHEFALIHLSQCYDFCHDYLVEQGKDTTLVQAGFKRMADRIIEGGDREGNWNLFQSKIIAHGGMVLEPNENYDDGKGHEYYIDIVLNADLPNQRGIIKVVEEGYDPDTALWPEAPSYGFETTSSILDIASLVSIDPQGAALLQHPLLERAILAQLELLHPNGLSIGLGDTINTRVSAKALELMISAAQKKGQDQLERRLTTVLQNEIKEGRYSRRNQITVNALCHYVADLLDGETIPAAESRTYDAQPLDLLMMRLPAPDSRHSLSAALFGTAGRHVHANGLAIELYGAGRILGADPGRGSSYWQRDYRHYYSRSPAHNTVIPMGNAEYNSEEPGQIRMEPGPTEPAPGKNAISPNVGFAQRGFTYTKHHAEQQRTLALIRTGEKSGFYFDVFRSRLTKKSKKEHHDYLYHGMAQAMSLTAGNGKPVNMTKCDRLGAEHGDMPGYDYFLNEQQADGSNDLRAQFELTLSDGSTPTMNLWMPKETDRTAFSLIAPQNRAIRNQLPPDVRNLPMPTLLLRKQGEAWDQPFVAIYEAFFKKDGPSIHEVQRLENETMTKGLASVLLKGQDSLVLLIESDDKAAPCTTAGVDFKGTFGAVIGAAGRIDELYLGHGHSLGFAGLRVSAKGSEPVSASLRRMKDGSWECTATGEVLVETPTKKPIQLPTIFQ